MTRKPRMLLPAMLLPAILMPFAAAAQPLPAPVVLDCADRADAESILEPWEANIATYAGGDVRIAVLDRIEPAAGAVHLLVLSPPRDEVGGRQCRVVSAGEGGIGFFDMDLAGRRADYDPARGLTLRIPIKVFDPASGGGLPATLRVTLDQASGAITASAGR